MSKENEQIKKNITCSQISRLEKPEELKLHHIHENSCF
jgi:hypothetical protein